MQSEITVKITDKQWHRNGVCGIGFVVVEFTFSDGEHTDKPAKMVIFHPEGEGATPEHYAVITDDTSEKWRGDWFLPAIWPQVSNTY